MNRGLFALALLLACSREPTRELALIEQASTTDCGDAALAMTLNWYGKRVSLADVTAEMPPGPLGVNAKAIVDAATARGLSVAGVKLETAAHVRMLQRGDIVHVHGDHFVVVDALAGDQVRVLDPADGARVIDPLRDSASTHVALLFAATPDALARRLRP